MVRLLIDWCRVFQIYGSNLKNWLQFLVNFEFYLFHFVLSWSTSVLITVMGFQTIKSSFFFFTIYLFFWLLSRSNFGTTSFGETFCFKKVSFYCIDRIFLFDICLVFHCLINKNIDSYYFPLCLF